MQKVTPPAPAGVDENSSSPMEEFIGDRVVVHVDVRVEAERQLTFATLLFWHESGDRE